MRRRGWLLVSVLLSAAVLGIVIPIAASAVPVWRALRVEPIEAIRTGHLAARSNRVTGWTPSISGTRDELRSMRR